jgi:FHS family L-fucose permease-like MFS transporter
MASAQRSLRTSAFPAAFILTVSLIAMWGLGHRLYDALAPEFAATADHNSYLWALTRSMSNTVYVITAIPAALYAIRFGYKATILLGLGCVCIGSFTLYPAAGTHTFTYFLIASAVMACGWIILEISVNPLVALLGTRRHFIQRLNFAQCFYPVGTFAGVFAGRWLADQHLSRQGFSDHAIAHPYIVFGAAVLLMTFLFEEVRFPPLACERQRGTFELHLGRILRRPLFGFALVAQVCGVQALATSWQSGSTLFAETFAHTDFASSGLLCLLASFAAGRFAGTGMMGSMRPSLVLALFSAGGILAALVAASTGGAVAVAGAMAASFFGAVVWPTVLGIAIRDTGDDMKLATALVCMATAACGIVQVMGSVLVPLHAPHLAMLLPVAGFIVVLLFARACTRQTDA